MTDSNQPSAILTISRGPTAGKRFDIGAAPVTLGRHAQCDIQIEDRWMSRQHARIAWSGAGYVVEDLGSTNGTFVNGERVTGSRALKRGDIVRLGEEVELVFHVSVPAALHEEPSPAGMAPAAVSSAVPPQAQAPRPKPEGRGVRIWVLASLGLLLVLIAAGVTYYLLSDNAQEVADTPGTREESPTTTPTSLPTAMPIMAQANATFTGPMTISSRGRNASAQGGEIEFQTSADGTALVSLSYSLVEGECTYVSGSSTTTVSGGFESTLFFEEPVRITNGRFTVDSMGVRAKGTLTSPSEANGEITIEKEEMMTSPTYQTFVCQYGTWTWTASVE